MKIFAGPEVGHVDRGQPWPDGRRTHLELPPVAFLRRLCGIVPPSAEVIDYLKEESAPGAF